jgi:hypothetical protein
VLGVDQFLELLVELGEIGVFLYVVQGLMVTLVALVLPDMDCMPIVSV